MSATGVQSSPHSNSFVSYTPAEHTAKPAAHQGNAAPAPPPKPEQIPNPSTSLHENNNPGELAALKQAHAHATAELTGLRKQLDEMTKVLQQIAGDYKALQEKVAAMPQEFDGKLNPIAEAVQKAYPQNGNGKHSGPADYMRSYGNLSKGAFGMAMCSSILSSICFAFMF